MSSILPERAIDEIFQVSLGNDHEMKAFYVPELESNALRIEESEGDLSIAVNQLMKASARAQLVRETDAIDRVHSYAPSSFLNLYGNGVWSGNGRGESSIVNLCVSSGLNNL